MDFTLTPEQQSFRDEVRDWLKRNLPRSWVERLHGGSDIPRPDAYEFLRQWQGKLNEAGFMGLTLRTGHAGGQMYFCGCECRGVA